MEPPCGLGREKFQASKTGPGAPNSPFRGEVGRSHQGEKAAHLLVVGLDAAGKDVVIPAVDGDGAVGQSVGDRGLGFQVEQLGNDIPADESAQLGVVAVGGVEWLAVAEGRFDVAEPSAGPGETIEALAV